MAVDAFIAGHYNGTYNAVAVGVTKEGFTLETNVKQEVVDETDAYGGSTLDFVHRGSDAFLEFVCRAFKAGAITPFYPWGSLGVVATAAAPIGRLASTVAQAMVITGATGTAAQDATDGGTVIASLTASKAILAPNFNGKLLFNSKLREVPIRLQLLPTITTGDLKYFVTT